MCAKRHQARRGETMSVHEQLTNMLTEKGEMHQLTR